MPSEIEELRSRLAALEESVMDWQEYVFRELEARPYHKALARPARRSPRAAINDGRISPISEEEVARLIAEQEAAAQPQEPAE